MQTRLSPDTLDSVEAEIEATGLPKALVISQRLRLAYELHPENLTIAPAPTE